MLRIICEPCADKLGDDLYRLHPEDAAMGFQKRAVKLTARKPADHCVTINGEKQPQLASIVCDDCGQPIPDGKPAVAVSMWRGGGLAQWEHEYGEIKT